MTHEALGEIARVTLANVSAFERGELQNEVRAEDVLRSSEQAPAPS
ncbi:MAG: hypothetical protein HY901_13430 [Deltaproteobacteria bacterium]|nr:hypothetical protein [Deltaproteobacteria bacterium]